MKMKMEKTIRRFEAKSVSEEEAVNAFKTVLAYLDNLYWELNMEAPAGRRGNKLKDNAMDAIDDLQLSILMTANKIDTFRERT